MVQEKRNHGGEECGDKKAQIFHAKLTNFLCVSVCVGTWVLVLNPCYGGKENVDRWSFGFNLSSITRDGILKRVLIKLLIRYVLSRVQFSVF